MGVPIVHAQPTNGRSKLYRQRKNNELKRQEHGNTRNQAAVHCGLSAT